MHLNNRCSTRNRVKVARETEFESGGSKLIEQTLNLKLIYFVAKHLMWIISYDAEVSWCKGSFT